MHFLLMFRQTLSIGRFLGVNEEKVDCPLVFRGINCISLNENVWIDTENDKNPKISCFQRF